MKKSYIDLNDLPEMVKTNEISALAATKLIAADVLQKPQNYKVPVTNEEIRSELSLRLIQNSDYIFSHFKNDLCSFKTYLCSFIRFQIMNIIRDAYKKDKIDTHVTEMSVFNYEDDNEKYKEDEASFKIGHTYNTCFNRPANCNKSYLVNESFTSFFETKPSKKIRSTLVLALKSCYYLTPDHIDKISNYCGIKRKELEILVNDLKESLKDKHDKLEEIKNHRDKSFELHIKFQKLIEKASTESKKQEYLKCYARHTENWKKKNLLLQEQSFKVCPTNKRLAELLGVCERQIGYYLQNAENLLDTEIVD